MSFVIVSAAIGAGSALYGVGKSISQSSKANNIDANNARPAYQIPDEFKENVAMAKHMAQIGLPQQQYNNQLNGINRNQAGAIGALGRSANPGANLAAIVRGGNDAVGNLNSADATATQNNQRFAIGQNAQLGQQQLAAQQYNKFDKYTENYNESAALKGAASQNIQNGINGVAQTAGNLYGYNMMNGAQQPMQTFGSKLGLDPITQGNYGTIGQQPLINNGSAIGWGSPPQTNPAYSPFDSNYYLQKR